MVLKTTRSLNEVMICITRGHRDWQGSADGRKDIWRTPHTRELEGDKIWQDTDVGRGGKQCIYSYVRRFFGRSLKEFPLLFNLDEVEGWGT